MARQQNNGLSNLDLAVGLAGVSPVPVVGEIALSAFYYRILGSHEGGTGLRGTAIPAALITRGVMYATLYSSLVKSAMEMLNQ